MPAKGTSKFIVTDEILEQTEHLAGKGLSHEQIALVLGVSERTVFKHKKENEQFAQAIRKGQAKGISDISNSLFETAKSGNVTAQIFFLTNRDPQNWRDRRFIDQTIHKDPTHKKIKKTMTPQEAAESYYDTLRDKKAQNVVSIKRRK